MRRTRRSDFRDTEDLDGLFSGYDPRTGTYDTKAWHYEITWTFERAPSPTATRRSRYASMHGMSKRPQAQRPDAAAPALRVQRPQAALRALHARDGRTHLRSAAGESFLRSRDTLMENSGRERTDVYAYAMGWTQHTIGVQNIRAAATLQALLGNTGRPGGGIMALRGHAKIQGSTDIPTLYDSFPGYLKMPTLEKDETDFADWTKNTRCARGGGPNIPNYAVVVAQSVVRRAATPSNDWGFAHLPLNTGDHSELPMFFAMKDGEVEGLVLYGQNPAVGGQNAALQRGAMERLEWMVVRDMFENETAAFWKREGADPLEDRHRGVLPARRRRRRERRHVHEHDPPRAMARESRRSAGRCAQRPLVHLRARETDQRAVRRIDAPNRPADPRHDVGLRERRPARARARRARLKVMQEINGYRVATGEQLRDSHDLRDDGSTACGAWIYTGHVSGAGPQPDRAARGTGANTSRAELGVFVARTTRRTLYNRASADPDGQAVERAQEARLVGRGRAALDRRRRAGLPAAYGTVVPRARRGARRGRDRRQHAVRRCSSTAARRSSASTAPPTGRCRRTTSRASRRSATRSIPSVQYNPVLKEWRRRDNPYHAIGDEVSVRRSPRTASPSTTRRA